MKKPFSITVEESLYDYARQQAEKENRTLSNFIEMLISKDKEEREEHQ